MTPINTYKVQAGREHSAGGIGPCGDLYLIACSCRIDRILNHRRRICRIGVGRYWIRAVVVYIMSIAP